MKKQRMHKHLALLLAIVMGFGMLPLMAYAETTQEPVSYDINGSKKASPTALTPSNRETTVTLSLPSAEYQNEVDIVFVMDKSSSADEYSTVIDNAVEDMVENLRELNSQLKINIGVVKFRGYATDAIKQFSSGAHSGLVEYTNSTAKIVSGAIKASPNGSGTNIHGGLDMANDWLEADTDLPDDNKYVVLLTDGKSYIWNDENDKPTTNYTQWYIQNEIQDGGKPVLNQIAGAHDKEASLVDALDSTDKSHIFWFNKYDDLFASDDIRLSGVTKYDEDCYYATSSNSTDLTFEGDVAEHSAKTGADQLIKDYKNYYAFTPTPDSKWVGMDFYEANPYEVIAHEDGTFSFDKYHINPDYYMYNPDCLQKGLYKAGHLWSDMNGKYNCGAILYEAWWEGSGSGYSIAKSFCTWLKHNSDYGANSESTDELKALFSNISTDIIYLIGRGKVTDTINSDSFELVRPANSLSPFTLTVDGAVLPPIVLGSNKWGYGSDGQGGFDYVVEYEAYDPVGKYFTWFINVKVENAKPIRLSYNLAIKPDAPDDLYDTNESAILDFVSSNEKFEGEYTFEKPKVTYTTKQPVVPGDANVPRTGDSSRLALWLALAGVSLCGVMVALHGQKRSYSRNGRSSKG